ncbi:MULTISPECIES: MFS transporter [unclassified Enterococcus]|uniref:MFS transporter n=1 Tax=unclassified Enterococcus TaxID=2608891 RepID=UPI001CE1507B|nr:MULTISPECIES: MFS transporter [unclassified Enterococcus]MCA5014477.1 MFS transporter [Enterococcus sp. S23]MCA5017409.1 MFS transporter [Enterococcus sp. S22(2020)]
MIKKMTIQVRTILLGTLFTRITFFMSTPFLAIYLSNSCQFSAVEIGYILSISPLISVLCSPIGGYLSDKVKFQTLLIYTAIFWGTIFIGFFFASTVPQFLFLNALNGFCYVIFEPTAKRTLSLFSLPEERLSIYNFRYASINIGAFLGPLLHSLFTDDSSLFSYLVLGGSYIVYGLLLFITMRKEPPAFKQQISDCKRTQKNDPFSIYAYIFLLLGVTFSYFGYAQFNSTVPQFFNTRSLFPSGASLYSAMLMINAALILLLQVPIIRCTKRISSFATIIISNMMFACSLFLLPRATDLLVFFMVALSYSLGELFLGVRFDYLVDQLAPKGKKGFYFGLAEIPKLGNTFGPIIGAYLIQSFSMTEPHKVFFTLALITLGGSFFIKMSARKAK